MILADFGTSYCKIIDTDNNKEPTIMSSRQIPADFKADLATGHNAKRRSRQSINELTALALGGKELIKENSFTLLDCGSRDTKFIRCEHGDVTDMGWNAECGASMGFTIEMVATYYKIDLQNLPPADKSFSVTCGVLGMSQIFDAIIDGMSEQEAVARLIRGIAKNSYRFAGSPEKLYLSGGLCDIPVFRKSFPCELIPLGRFVLLNGLKRKLSS